MEKAKTNAPSKEITGRGIKKAVDLPIDRKKAWDETDVSLVYGTPVGTLRNWRSQKKGPRYFKVGSRVIYRQSDCEKFFFANPVLTIDSRE